MCVCPRFKDTLVNTVGHRVAEQALQLGLLFPPAEALRVGLVDRVVPEDQVQSTALSVMAQWMAIPGEGQPRSHGRGRWPRTVPKPGPHSGQLPGAEAGSHSCGGHGSKGELWTSLCPPQALPRPRVKRNVVNNTIP